MSWITATGFISCSLFYGMIFHLLSSALWALGFAGAMSAFDGTGYIFVSKALFVIHGIIFFPALIVAWIKMGSFSTEMAGSQAIWDFAASGMLSPFPTIATVTWCLLMGTGARLMVTRKKRTRAKSPRSPS